MTIVIMKITMRILKQDARPLAVFLSLLLSFSWYCYQQPINVDGTLYINITHIYLAYGLTAVFHHFYWPFYSIIIAYLHKITGLSLLNAAYVLNAFFFALITFYFISIIKILKGDIFLQYLAALVIIFYPTLAHEHTMVIRDFGYYAFALGSFKVLLQFSEQHKLSYGIAWNLFMLLASLFRYDGLLFLSLIPWFVFCWEGNIRHKCITLLKLNVLNCIGTLILLVFFISHQNTWRSLLVHLPTPTHVFSMFLNQYHTYIHHIQNYVFNVFGKKYADVFLLGGIVAILITFLIKTVNLVYGFLILYALNRRIPKFNQHHRIIFISYIFLNLFLLLGFLSYHLFITERYVLFLALLLLLFVPFSIYDIFKRFPIIWSNKLNWQASGLLIALLAMVLSSSYHFGANRSYYLLAGHWVNQNTSKNSSIFVNDQRLSFYIHRKGMEYFFLYYGKASIPIHYLLKIPNLNYDYAAILVENNKTKSAEIFFKKNHFVPQKIFTNNHKDKIYILSLKKHLL